MCKKIWIYYLRCFFIHGTFATVVGVVGVTFVTVLGVTGAVNVNFHAVVSSEQLRYDYF